MTNTSLPLNNLAIYYGYPSYVNQVYSVPGAISVFNDYDLVVIGDGLEENNHPDHQNTKDIIDCSTANFYGYVDSTLPLKDIKKKVDKWCGMGGINKIITGVLADRFGYDFGIDRVKQNKIIDYIHSSGLRVMVNAWDPDDVFSISSGEQNTHLTSNDWYLAQSHYVINGEWQDKTIWEQKSDKMNLYKSQTGVKMACIATSTISSGYVSHKWNAAYSAHTIYGFNASGWGEPDFSAPSSTLPWRPRLQIPGTHFTSPLQKDGVCFSRSTNIGIQIDTFSHVSSNLLE